MSILLTNDDGIDSPGIEALYDRLSTVTDVVVVAPKTDQSGVGRARSGMGEARSNTVDIADHEWGYVVDGTPADCAAVGLRGIPEADTVELVVSGCNHGPNVGSYILGHSGTVSAVVEASFLGVPGIAVSAYDPATYYPDDDSFGPAGTVTTTLAETVLDSSMFDDVDLLNVNVPSQTPNRIRLTTPLADYETTVNETGDTNAFKSNYWAENPIDGEWEPALVDYQGVYPTGTDRAAVVNGEVSITPFEAPQTVVEAPSALRELVETYNRQTKPESKS
jgi:5'-nucleotidase